MYIDNNAKVHLPTQAQTFFHYHLKSPIQHRISWSHLPKETQKRKPTSIDLIWTLKQNLDIEIVAWEIAPDEWGLKMIGLFGFVGGHLC